NRAIGEARGAVGEILEEQSRAAGGDGHERRRDEGKNSGRVIGGNGIRLAAGDRGGGGDRAAVGYDHGTGDRKIGANGKIGHAASEDVAGARKRAQGSVAGDENGAGRQN